MGIDDIDARDFAAEVKRVVGTKERLFGLTRGGQINKQVPLLSHYRKFLCQSSMDWREDLGKLTRQLRGPKAGFSIDSCAST